MIRGDGVIFAVSVLVVLGALVGAWLLRPGGWFDQRVADAVDGPLS